MPWGNDCQRVLGVSSPAMGKGRTGSIFGGSKAANSALACLCACVVLLSAAVAIAQDAPKARAAPQETPKVEASTPPVQSSSGFLGAIGRWVDQTANSFNDGARYMRDRIQNLGRDASVAAKSTVDTAKDAADAVGRIPNSRMVVGHEKCETAPNGAPDCIAAAYNICRAKGFNIGKSVDMTTAEVCPPQVYLAGRNSGPECTTETFVSRALCQ